MMRPLTTLSLVGLCLASCKNPTATTPVDEPDFITDIPASVRDDPDGDEDGDGLTNGEELAGWPIEVNSTGVPGARVTTQVFSHPLRVDSDNDGIDDPEEQAARTNPLLADTDGDLLSDEAEMNRWGTNPTEVDTDGDAVPSDAAGFVGAPLRQMFDGYELDVQPDGSAGPLATSPVLADTDGDGWSDYEEATSSIRDGGIAEHPEITVTMTPGSRLDLALDVTYTGDITESVSHTASLTVDESAALTSSTVASASLAVDTSARVRVGVSANVGCCLNVADVGASLEEEFRVRTTLETANSIGFTVDGTLAATESHDRYRQRSSTEATTVDGATVQGVFELRNPTNRTVTVDGLNVLVYFRDQGALRPLAVLTGLTEAITLYPGETLPDVLLRDDAADPEEVEAAMSAPGRVLITPASYDLVDITGTPIAFQQEVIAERTAGVALRFPDHVERYNVAANVHRDADGNLIGIPVSQVFERFGVPASSPSIDNPVNGQTEPDLNIAGLGTVFYTSDDDPLSGLDVMGYPTSGGPGPRNFAEMWVGMINSPQGDPQLASMLDLMLQPGEVLEIVRAVDRDRDGLADIEELIAGTSDGTVDSDAVDGRSDGLSDFFELNEPWMVTVVGRPPYEVYANPTAIDGDADGLDDSEERALGTNPRLPDTDGDGWSDGSEADYGQDPLFTDGGPETLSIQCRSTDAGGEWHYQVLVDDPEDITRTFGLRRGLQVLEEFVHPVPVHGRLQATFDYPQTLGPTPVVFVRDEFGLEQVLECPPTQQLYAKTCLRCPETLPVASCTTNPLTGEVTLSAFDAGDDLIHVDTRYELTAFWGLQRMTLPDPGIQSQITNGDAEDVGDIHSESSGFDSDHSYGRDLSMVRSWSTDVDGDPTLSGSRGSMANLQFLVGGGVLGATDALLAEDQMVDAHLIPNVGRPSHPFQYDVRAEVSVMDVDGNVDFAECTWDLNATTPRSCKEILTMNPGSVSGTYTIDNGSGGTRQVYCDMVDHGGGWTFVRNTADSDVNWGPWTDDLVGTDLAQQLAQQTAHAPSPQGAGGTWTLKFDHIPHTEVMFRTGDGSRNCVFAMGWLHVRDGNGNNRHTNLLSGTTNVTPGTGFPNNTGVHQRRSSSNPEDPWVTCQEDYFSARDNDDFMYGEAGQSFKRQNMTGRGDRGVWIR